jgi:hypothetical protein
VLYLSIPVWFGYGLARDPANLEFIKEWVSAGRRDGRCGAPRAARCPCRPPLAAVGSWRAASARTATPRQQPTRLQSACSAPVAPAGGRLASQQPRPPAACGMQFPTKAADARGEHGRKLPTLEEEYRRVRLDQAIEDELDRIARRKAAQQQGGTGK